MPLDVVAEVSIKHRQVGSSRLPWYTTYFIRALTPATNIDYDTALDVIAALIDAEARLYYNVVEILGGTARSYRAATVVPDPSPPPYDPADHVAYNTSVAGDRSPGSGEVMFYDQIIDIMRNPEFGNPGHLEIRGALSEADVAQTLGTKQLTPAGVTVWETLIDTFEDEVKNIAINESVEFLMVGQPLLSTSWEIGPSGKPRSIKTYGAAYFRPIQSWTRGLVRTDKGANRYFDHGL